MLQFFGPKASIHGLDARIVTFGDIMQVKCKLDVARMGHGIRVILPKYHRAKRQRYPYLSFLVTG